MLECSVRVMLLLLGFQVDRLKPLHVDQLSIGALYACHAFASVKLSEYVSF